MYNIDWQEENHLSHVISMLLRVTGYLNQDIIFLLFTIKETFCFHVPFAQHAAL